MNKREFKGELDVFGYPFIYVDLINTVTNERIIKVKAIIDTGASGTHIKPEIIIALDLLSNGNTEIKHATDGNVKSGIFKLNIEFNNSTIVPDVTVFELTQPEYPSGMIIGLNILKHCNFNYDSVNKLFSFHLFPISDIPSLEVEKDS
tara:strand:+ start:64 stop:507 length:444 start_codon:yes stop_codon:yes gene_type:complete